MRRNIFHPRAAKPLEGVSDFGESGGNPLFHLLRGSPIDPCIRRCRDLRIDCTFFFLWQIAGIALEKICRRKRIVLAFGSSCSGRVPQQYWHWVVYFLYLESLSLDPFVSPLLLILDYGARNTFHAAKGLSKWVWNDLRYSGVKGVVAPSTVVTTRLATRGIICMGYRNGDTETYVGTCEISVPKNSSTAAVSTYGAQQCCSRKVVQMTPPRDRVEDSTEHQMRVCVKKSGAIRMGKYQWSESELLCMYAITSERSSCDGVLLR